MNDGIRLAWRCREAGCEATEERPIGVAAMWDIETCENCGSDDGAFVLLVPLPDHQRAHVFSNGRVSLHFEDVNVE